MQRITVREHESIPRASIGHTLLSRLQALDERHALHESEQVFDWSRIREIRARNHVGVVQVPGLTIEILPKIDDAAGGPSDLAQRNLLYMLAFTRDLPIRERDLAQLDSLRLPLLDKLIRLFVERLIEQLRLGVDRQYLYREENARFLRGKLLISEHLKRNAAHRERLFVGYEEFLADTWLNRILKACCRRMLTMTGSNRTRQRLSEAIVCLADVEDCTIRPHHFQRVRMTRSNQRYEMLLRFAKMVLLDRATAPQAGPDRMFSLLFPMESLFEQFIARFMKRFAVELGLRAEMIHLQASRRRRHLVLTEQGQRAFWLKPDILIDGRVGVGPTVVDTKWKRLAGAVAGGQPVSSAADLYQLYGYADRYAAAQSILLYPMTDTTSAQRFRLDRETDQQLRVEFVDLRRDLRTRSAELRAELRNILAGPPAVSGGLAP